MESVVVACVALFLIVLALVVPSGGETQDAIKQDQTLGAMQLRTDEAKREMTQLHEAYRAELARAVRAHRANRRT